MSQVGRIGGHLLEANLERQGIDVAFKNTTFDSTPILYLDVTNNRIGVKTDSPQYDLDIQTDVSTTNAEATAQARLDNVLINAPATFSTITGPLNIVPAPIWMVFKILFLFFLFAIIKAIVPRYRYDQLMRLGWKIFLPFSLLYLILTASFLFYFDKLPKGNF